MSFYKLGIKGELVYALETMGIDTPTPIQNLSIKHILNRKDLLAEAQTGTGKTLAFLLPLVQLLDIDQKNIQCMIIAPTRELAIQITDVARKLQMIKPYGLLAAYGGQDIQAQLHKLESDVHVIVGTPGRILDHLTRESIDCSYLNALVIDEADQLFHIGFKEELKKIIKFLPKDRQTLCFSATLSHRVNSFKNHYLVDPIHVVAPKKQITLDKISQLIIETSNRKKFSDLEKIISEDPPNKAIIFCRSRRGADALYDEMKEKYSVEVLHGGLTQAKREYVMKTFKESTLKFLVATDVAARGLDIENITHVYNYNLPDDTENYVHRIGRTGRSNKDGKSYILLTSKDHARLESIEKFIQQKIERKTYSVPEPIEKAKPPKSNSYHKKKKFYQKYKKK